jgi:PKD repeat protein
MPMAIRSWLTTIGEGHSTIADSDQWLCVANDVESAIAIALSPGNYTAILSGKNNATGNALIEMYALN